MHPVLGASPWLAWHCPPWLASLQSLSAPGRLHTLLNPSSTAGSATVKMMSGAAEQSSFTSCLQTYFPPAPAPGVTSGCLSAGRHACMHARGGRRAGCFRPISGAGSRCATSAGALPRSSPGCHQPVPQGVQAEPGPRLATSGKHPVQQVRRRRCCSGANPGCVSTERAGWQAPCSLHHHSCPARRWLSHFCSRCRSRTAELSFQLPLELCGGYRKRGR